jgi:hypothetical protein
VAEPWIRVHADLARKKVTWRVVKALGVSKHEAMGLLTEFWGNVSRVASRGHTRDVTDEQIESWADWRGEPGLFAKFVREQHTDEDGTIHEWDEYAGTFEDRRDKERKRQERHRLARRAERERQAGNGVPAPRDTGVTSRDKYADATRDSTRDVTRMSPGVRDDTITTTPPAPPLARGGGKAKRSRTGGQATLLLGEIKSLVTRANIAGQGVREFIPHERVEALGPAVVEAYDAIGGAERVLAATGDDWGYVVRDFASAYQAARQRSPPAEEERP